MLMGALTKEKISQTIRFIQVPVSQGVLSFSYSPIVRVYTHKSAANIVGKHECSLIVDLQRFTRANNVYFSNKSVST